MEQERLQDIENYLTVKQSAVVDWMEVGCLVHQMEADRLTCRMEADCRTCQREVDCLTRQREADCLTCRREADCLTCQRATWVCLALCGHHTPPPLDMPAWYLNPWQLSLKYWNSAIELPGDSVARLEHGSPFARLWVRVPLCVTVTFFFPLFLSLSPFFLTDLTWAKVWLSVLEHV